MGSTRRTYFIILMSAVLATALAASPPAVQAKDGGSDGGGSGGGDSSRSGHGGGDDDGGDNHGGRGKDDNGGGTTGGSASSSPDYDRARDAVRNGQVMPLKSILKKIDASRYGRIIDIRLSRSLSRDIYQLKLRDNNGVIRTLRVDARSGILIGSN